MDKVVDDRVKVYNIETLTELIASGCQWLHNYLEYGQATDADRALCNLPPRRLSPRWPLRVMPRAGRGAGGGELAGAGGDE